MEPRKIVASIAAFAAALIALALMLHAHFDPNKTASAQPVVNVGRARDHPSVALPLPSATAPQARAISGNARRTPAQWQQGLASPDTIAQAVGEAALAAESGDFGALRALHTLTTICAPIMEYVRTGGSRERHLDAQPYLPTGGRAQLAAAYDRCAAVASAPALAGWSLTDGRLSHPYWERVGRQLGDPLFASFDIEEMVSALPKAAAGERATLKAAIAENVRRLLRSGDGAAWVDFGARTLPGKVTSDSSISLALILIGCERGYDCSGANTTNMSLNCSVNMSPDCGGATTLQEQFALRNSAGVNARAYSRYLELIALIQQDDWAAIENYVPLDGSSFR